MEWTQTFEHHCKYIEIQQTALVRAEVNKLLDKGVIVGSTHEPDEFISNMFLRKKKDGTYKIILKGHWQQKILFLISIILTYGILNYTFS